MKIVNRNSSVRRASNGGAMGHRAIYQRTGLAVALGLALTALMPAASFASADEDWRPHAPQDIRDIVQKANDMATDPALMKHLQAESKEPYEPGDVAADGRDSSRIEPREPGSAITRGNDLKIEPREPKYPAGRISPNNNPDEAPYQEGRGSLSVEPRDAKDAISRGSDLSIEPHEPTDRQDRNAPSIEPKDPSTRTERNSVTIPSTIERELGSSIAQTRSDIAAVNARLQQVEQAAAIEKPRAGGQGYAFGAGSFAKDARDTAIGRNGIIEADGSTGVGNNFYISASGTNSVAVGADSSVRAPSGTAVGQGSSVTADNAVALGQGSVADRANAVSVGHDNANRQVTHVAAGTAATDAVNVQQLNSATDWAKSYTDKRFGDMNRSIHQVDRRASAGTAGAMALTTIPQGLGPNQTMIGAGVGTFNGQSALAVGLTTTSETGKWALKAGLTSDTRGQTGAAVGVGFAL